MNDSYHTAVIAADLRVKKIIYMYKQDEQKSEANVSFKTN